MHKPGPGRMVVWMTPRPPGWLVEREPIQLFMCSDLRLTASNVEFGVAIVNPAAISIPVSFALSSFHPDQPVHVMTQRLNALHSVPLSVVLSISNARARH